MGGGDTGLFGGGDFRDLLWMAFFGYMCTVSQVKGVCLEVQPAEDALEGVGVT